MLVVDLAVDPVRFHEASWKVDLFDNASDDFQRESKALIILEETSCKVGITVKVEKAAAVLGIMVVAFSFGEEESKLSLWVVAVGGDVPFALARALADVGAFAGLEAPLVVGVDAGVVFVRGDSDNADGLELSLLSAFACSGDCVHLPSPFGPLADLDDCVVDVESELKLSCNQCLAKIGVGVGGIVIEVFYQIFVVRSSEVDDEGA
jgi:hypothetical protein